MDFRNTIIILGGTGFVGRAMVEKYLNKNWRVVVSVRLKDIEEAKSKLVLHGFNQNLLEKFIDDGSLLILLDVDLTDKKWRLEDSWVSLLNRVDVDFSVVNRVINLVGQTSGPAEDIFEANIITLDSILKLVRIIKNKNSGAIFISMGSISEKSQGKNLSPYEHAKKVVRIKIEESGLCDFYLIAYYIKGKGEQKVKSFSDYLWRKLRLSHRWLFGFKVSIIDVDDLAHLIYYIVEVLEIAPLRRSVIEVNFTNGEMIFGDMIKNLLPKDKRVIPKAIIPSWLDGSFLRVYCFLILIFKSNDQLARRLASFARRSLMSLDSQEDTHIFKSAEEIKRLSKNINRYKILDKNEALIISEKSGQIIYVLREKSQEELEKIVQKALDKN